MRISSVRRAAFALVLALLAAVCAPVPNASAFPPQGWVDVIFPSSLHDLAIDEVRGVLYLTVPDARLVVVVDKTTADVIDVIPLPGVPQDVDLSASGDELYVALFDAGGVWVLDLNTGASTTVSAQPELGSAKAFDVLEIDDRKLLVTGAPGSGGFAFVVLLDLDAGTRTRVAGERIIRGGPRLDRAGPNSVLIGEDFSPNSLYRLDLTDPNIPLVAEDDHGSISGATSAAATPDGSLVFLNSQIVRTSDITQVGSVRFSGEPAVTADGSVVAHLGETGLSLTDVNTFQHLGVVPSGCGSQLGDTAAEFDSGGILYAITEQRLCAHEIFREPQTARFAVRAPAESIGRHVGAGAVTLLQVDEFGNAAGSTLIHQGTPGIPGANEAGDSFGARLAWGDFDGNGTPDLAISSPLEAIGSLTDAGAVTVLYDVVDGRFSRAQLLHQGSPQVAGANEADDRWGTGLDAGDINGDGIDDLLVGAPGEDVGSIVDAGAVTVLFGTPSGISGDGSQLYHQGSRGVPGANEADDLFGYSVAFVSDPGGTGFVGVGAIGEDVRGIDDLGAVTIFDTTSTGLKPASQLLYPGAAAAGNRPSLVGLPTTAGDRFGFRLVGDDLGNLIIGNPFADLPGATDGGYVILYSGLRGSPTAVRIDKATPGIPGDPGQRDLFGFALDNADVSGRPTLVVGHPDETVEGQLGAGAMTVIPDYHSGTYGLASTWTQAMPNVPGLAEAGDFFGNSVQINPSGQILVGAPAEDLGPHVDVGAINIFFGTPADPAIFGVLSVHQGSPGVPGNNESNDLWSG